MSKIASIIAAPTAGGFFFDDKEAIANTAKKDGFSYVGRPVTSGFERVRQPAEAVSVVIELENGQIGMGDCTAVQYSGFGGRDTLFDAQSHIDVIESTVSDAFAGREACELMNNINVIQEIDKTVEGLHTAVRYGLSQALLNAAATAQSKTMAEVIVDAYEIDLIPKPVPIYAQTGNDRRSNAEKMILKGIPVLPHGLFNSVEKIGNEGEHLIEYLNWLSNRVSELGPAKYNPVFHVDVYGTIGEIFEPPYDRSEIINHFTELKQAASPYSLQVESPIEAESRQEQIRALGELRDGLAECSISVDIVADEWCNTYDDITAFVDADAVDIVQIKTPDLGEITRSVEAIRYCGKTDTCAYLGGSCAETEVSARVCSHIAIATQPIQMLAKPGMGVDEGYLIVNNEMQRTIRRITDGSY